MPGTKRMRDDYAGGGGGYGGGGMRRGRQARRFRVMSTGSKSLAGAMSRVHVFKRVGKPLVITNKSSPSVRAAGVAASNITVLGPSPVFATDPILTNYTSCRFGTRYTLNNVSGVGEITSLFDNYRIKKISLRIDWGFNQGPGVVEAGVPGSVAPLSGGPWSMPICHYTYDPDDAAAPSSTEDLLQNSYAKTQRLGDKAILVTFTPRAQATVQATPGTAVSGGLLPTGQWLDCTNPNIEHYGMKFVIDQFPYISGDDIAALTITPTFYIEAKNVV